MTRKAVFVVTTAAAIVGAGLLGSVPTASAAEQVAGRPALPTSSTEDLFKMREQWGDKPSGMSDQGGSQKSETEKK